MSERIPLNDPFLNRLHYAPGDYGKIPSGPVLAAPVMGYDDTRPLGFLYTDRGFVLGFLRAAVEEANDAGASWTRAIRDAYGARTPAAQVFDYWTLERDPGHGWHVGPVEQVRDLDVLRERMANAWR